MSLKDVLIIGGGPAGLSAATTLVRQLHTVLVFDSGSYRNGKVKHVHNLPTWDYKNPAEFREAAKHDLVSNYHTVDFENVEIVSLKEGVGCFEVQDGKGRVWKGKKVIIATGVEDILPDIEGYADCWGSLIFHCLFCHGYENRGESAGVLAIGICATPRLAMHVARNAAQLCKTVTIFTNGSSDVFAALVGALGDSAIFNVDKRVITRVSRAKEDGILVEFDDGSHQVESFLAHVPMSCPRGPFVEQLQLKTCPPMGDLEVSQPFLQTSQRGIFAAGDNMIMAKAMTIAVANGAIAANSASSQLQAERYGHPPMF
ncbi:thioredoxin reductase glit-like protein [Amylocarpus encephaloides]|uniref:Thioredoxin reductase glit-like protein n=1 Tax=Amylocarpus encephaloides TaxID=45428 RepID=A0A9P7YDC3_9HELO|nr:thioredoxin reductase glit-like protein [Amylocarpus encephaloides]